MVSNNTGQPGGGQAFGPGRTFSGIGFLLEQWETNEFLSGMASQDRIYILNGSSGCRGHLHNKALRWERLLLCPLQGRTPRLRVVQ